MSGESLMKEEEDATGPVDHTLNRDAPNRGVVAKACTDDALKLAASKARTVIAGQIIGVLFLIGVEL
jgi:hypothetical protein